MKDASVKRKRDYSMLYAVLAGFGMFVLVVSWLLAHTDGDSSLYGPLYSLFPDGTEILEETDSHGGFHGDGVAFLSAQIPPESSRDFAQKLRENGFAEMPLSEEMRWRLSGLQEGEAPVQITLGLWYFQDNTREPRGERCENYTFMAYDLDTCIYYYIEYDS